MRATMLGAAAVAALALAACSGGPEMTAPDSPWAAEIAFAQETATSDFERRVLADSWVTREEYDEAHHLWLECMERHYPPDGAYQVGIRLVESLGTYEYSFSAPPGVEHSDELLDPFQAVWHQCAIGTIDIVGTLYADATLNPDRTDREVLFYECLERGGLLPPDYTVEMMYDDYAIWPDHDLLSPSSPMYNIHENPDIHYCFAAPGHNN